MELKQINNFEEIDGYADLMAGEEQKQEDWKIIEAMEKYGGSFASSIAKACYHADGINYTRLRSAFPELFEEYKKFIK